MITLKNLVIQEAKKLKNKATIEEKLALDAKNLWGDSNYNCLYGQMTGFCHSKRAISLINLCCERVYKAIPTNGEYLKNVVLNGKPKRIKNRSSVLSFWSPIEVWLYRNPSEEKKQALVDYLQGKTNKLVI